MLNSRPGDPSPAPECKQQAPKEKKTMYEKIENNVTLRSSPEHQYFDRVRGHVGTPFTCTRHAPHMQGLRGQAIDWFGVNGGWYSLVKDEQADLQVNVRVTSPLPDEFPDRQLVTGLGIVSEGHSLAIEVKNPYTIDTDGCKGVSPCLANGGLRAIVDGKEVDGVLPFSKGVYVTDDIAVSASNLSVECRQFGGDKIWAPMYDEMVHGKRNLLAESMEDWILKSLSMAAPKWCVKYIAENDLADLQPTHALFKIETPTVTVRVNVGVNHQGDVELDWDGRVLPDLEFWQMDVGLNEQNIDNPFLTGLLGETARPVLDENGHEVMEGFDAFRGSVEDYRVSDALGTHFPLLDKLVEELKYRPITLQYSSPMIFTASGRGPDGCIS